MIKIDYYRVQGKWPYLGLGRFKPRRPWCRTWQAEWEGCQRAPRAFTLRGIQRKANRWAIDPKRNFR